MTNFDFLFAPPILRRTKWTHSTQRNANRKSKQAAMQKLFLSKRVRRTLFDYFFCPQLFYPHSLNAFQQSKVHTLRFGATVAMYVYVYICIKLERERKINFENDEIYTEMRFGFNFHVSFDVLRHKLLHFLDQKTQYQSLN